MFFRYMLVMMVTVLSIPTRAQTPPTVDYDKLARLVNFIEDEDYNIHSVLVIQNGETVLEAYRYPYTAETLHHVYSCTKSFTSASVGIAIEQGYIAGVDVPIHDFLPAAPENITLEHLLTMSAGFEWPGGMLEPHLNELWQSRDWLQFVLNRSVVNEPGTQFVYDSGVSNLLAAIVEEGTDQTNFAEENLLTPLDITHYHWNRDPQGHLLGGWGLWLTPRAMAKFGELYLQAGEWNGQQIVPAEWVATSTRAHIEAAQLAEDYGYQWWVDREGYFMALGFGGQYIIVQPELKLVVVFTSGLTPQSFNLPESLFKNFILPAVQAEVPADPAAVEDLNTAIEWFAAPEPMEVAPLPAMAEQISGQTYALEANDFGWEQLSLTFTPGATTAQATIDSDQLVINLDNTYYPNELPDYGTFMMKGSWLAENKFEIKAMQLGSADWLEVAVIFNEDGTARFSGQHVMGRTFFDGSLIP